MSVRVCVSGGEDGSGCSTAIAQCQALGVWGQLRAAGTGAGGRAEGFGFEVSMQGAHKGRAWWEQGSVPGMELAPVPWLSQAAWARGPVLWDLRSCGQGHTGEEFGVGAICCPMWGPSSNVAGGSGRIGETEPSSPQHVHKGMGCSGCGRAEHHAWN